jgi:hypothetical protein
VLKIYLMRGIDQTANPLVDMAMANTTEGRNVIIAQTNNIFATNTIGFIILVLLYIILIYYTYNLWYVVNIVNAQCHLLPS